MKIFKYSFVAFLGQMVLTLFIVTLCMFSVKLQDPAAKVFDHNAFTAYIGFFVILIPFVGEYFNRFVEFKDNYAIFNSFRIDKKVRSYNIRYEDILSLETTKIPLLGIYKVKVKAKNVPYIIPVTWCMKKHNELFYNLYSYAQKHNPKVYVDGCLIEQLKKKGYYEKN